MAQPLIWLLDVLRGAGLNVHETEGWRDRAAEGRPPAPIGVLQHHTATRTSPQNPVPTLNMCVNGRSDLEGPLCQALIGLDGSIHLVAAGRANHAGEAKASGPMPAAGSGNDIYIGFEWDYQGVEQHPSREQYDAAVRATAAVLRHLRVPAEHTRGHKETSVTGKIDPGNVDLNQFRAHVSAAMNHPAPQPNPPGPAPQPQPPQPQPPQGQPQGPPPLPPIPDSPPARAGNPGPPDPAVMRIVYLVGKHMKVSDYVMLAAFETGLVESQMSNLNWGHSTSLGVFQQRPEWWGTPQQLMDVRYAATKFFEAALKKERENNRRSAGELAQDVQDSAHPERYDQREAEARRLIDETARGVSAPPPGPNPPPPQQGRPPVPPPAPTPPPAPEPVVPAVFGTGILPGRDGALSAFATSLSGEVVTAWQVEPGGDWVGWLGIGGEPAGRPVAVREPSGGMAVFVRDDNGEVITSSCPKQGAKWGPWIGLRGRITDDPVAVLRPDGAIALYAVGQDGTLHSAAQAGRGGHWTDWDDHGGELIGRPAVALGPNGAVSVFARNARREVVMSEQGTAGAGWSDWKSLGGSMAGDPVVVTLAHGVTVLFAVGDDEQLYCLERPGEGGSWSALGGDFTGTPAVGLNPNGRLEVFVRDTSGAVHTAEQQVAHGGWTAWTDLGGELEGDPVAISRPDGACTLFAVGRDGDMRTAHQPEPDSPWKPWADLVDTLKA
ncbi:N-acetylmuramoyl-L-alanine amidase [Saccharopolyspora sp. TS4A08]|uniref:N-acetylmuramoyl-L-alanine amidase n=1 Tax=Saccharopolyspora ipomoeae TaxID=3042027 RepID=A0ABT6PYD8_9PSEU|nr:N-acetylmuramoyl-L-alanine amidase [Saccharopolyspora sp. TS4A08]MDI2032880.1 N-acetylmuramoyl-L-alanine amidase [Saccharopolyspora sp. TS4A08]